MPERFWEKVDTSGACWEWTGALNRRGYGVISIPLSGGRQVLAHRYAASLYFGMFDTRSLVCHHCDNPKCVREDHLYLGDPASNGRDMSRRSRTHNQRKTQCPKGHAYDDTNTYVSSQGKRHCRSCSVAHQATYRRKENPVANTKFDVPSPRS